MVWMFARYDPVGWAVGCPITAAASRCSACILAENGMRRPTDEIAIKATAGSGCSATDDTLPGLWAVAARGSAQQVAMACWIADRIVAGMCADRWG